MKFDIWNRKQANKNKLYITKNKQKIKIQTKAESENDGEDSKRVMFDKMQSEMEWKSSYLGVGLYGLATVEFVAYEAYGLTMLDFGILYGSSFLGLGFGILWSSFLLNKAEWFTRSENVANVAICGVFVTQIMISFIFLHGYYVLGEFTGAAWFFLIVSRFVLGFGIGFVESEISNNNVNNNNNDGNESETTGFGSLVSMGLFERHQVTAAVASKQKIKDYSNAAGTTITGSRDFDIETKNVLLNVSIVSS